MILCASEIPCGVISDASVSTDAHDDDRCEDAEQHTHTHISDMCVSFMHAQPHTELCFSLSVIRSIVPITLRFPERRGFLKSCSFDGEQRADAGSLCLNWLDIKPNIRPISLAGFWKKHSLNFFSYLTLPLLCTHTHIYTSAHTHSLRKPSFLLQWWVKNKIVPN